MQIPYDLEFVENRPLVRSKAVAVPEPPPAWLGVGRVGDQDVLDSILRWMHGLLRRIDERKPH